MNLFEILSIKLPELDPCATKLHLAVWNGQENPLDVYLAGDFEEWQTWQTQKNFERKYIVSLIQLPGNDRWLFAGCYESYGCDHNEKEKCYKYKIEAASALSDLTGRIVVSFKRSGRQSYLNAETWSEKIFVDELLSQKMVVEEFPGYSQSLISKSKLDIIVQQSLASWRSALSNVSGVYLITDTKTGKLYVGSATGEGGIWQRWCDYSNSGHGGNSRLIGLLEAEDPDYSSHFQYSILEIADTHTSDDAILKRESYWKTVLCCKEHGYNAN